MAPKGLAQGTRVRGYFSSGAERAGEEPGVRETRGLGRQERGKELSGWAPGPTDWFLSFYSPDPQQWESVPARLPHEN